MKKNILAIAAILTIVGASAFTAKSIRTADTKKAITTWYFIGDNLDQADQAEHWSTEDPQLGCGSGTAVPCRMNVEDADSQGELENFLDGKSDTEIRDVYSSAKRAL